MATANHERVGKALDLLGDGLRPFCEQKGWGKEAFSYYSLVHSRPEFERLSRLESNGEQVSFL